MQTVGNNAFSVLGPEDLLGSLNSVERKNAPAQLWIAGTADIFKRGPRVAIVGARKASGEGLRRAARLARDLVAQDVVVVSGLAEGIDAAAHSATIAAGGLTAAVLGTPVDVLFPPANRELQRRIMEDFVAVSQFPPGHPVLRTNFPRRNRTMALLTDATVIVEASDGSGTLSQGWEALRLGRPLFLMKSVVEGGQLSWPREMLQFGAEVLEQSEDLLEVLPFEEVGTLESLAF